MEDKKFSLDEILETMYAALYSLERERGQEANVDMAMMQAMMYPPFVILISLLDYEGKNGTLASISKITDEEKSRYEKEFDDGYKSYCEAQRNGGRA